MDFRGLWKPKPTKKLTKKKDIIIELKEFRDAWQKLIKLNIELDDDYLEKETLSNLKKKLNIFYSNDMKCVALKWLIFKYPKVYNNNNKEFKEMLSRYNINKINNNIFNKKNIDYLIINLDNNQYLLPTTVNHTNIFILPYILLILLYSILSIPVKKIKYNKKKEKKLVNSFKKLKSIKTNKKKSKKYIKKN